MSATLLSLAVLAAATSVPVTPDTTAIDLFVHHASRTLHSRIRIDVMRSMGRNETIARKIVEQVMDGQKRATVARRAEYTDNGWSMPSPGQIVLVYDFSGQPSFIYRVVATQQLPLRSISPWHLMAESPALRDVVAWRTAHLAAWKDTTSTMPPEKIEALPLVWMRFEPIYPLAKPPSKWSKAH